MPIPWVQIAMMVASAVLSEQQASRQRKIKQAQIESEKQRLKASHKIEERKRKEALKRQLAARRARMAASGAGGAGGSGRAILSGLISQSEKQREEAAQQLGWGIGDLNTKSLLNRGNSSLSKGLDLGLKVAPLLPTLDYGNLGSNTTTKGEG